MPGAPIADRRRALEELLAGMPTGLVEAKRYITQQNRKEPEPRVLQAMVKIAGDDAEEGPRRELPRTMLVLRSVADEQLAIMNGDGSAAPESLLAAAGVLAALERDLDRIEQHLSETLPRMAEADQDYLTDLHRRLVPSRERLRTAQVLARFFKLQERPDLPAEGGSAVRDGAILLHIIGRDLAAWLNRPAAAEGEQEADAESRDQIWRNLEEDREAYKTISKVLAAGKDAAFVQGPKPLFETLNQLQRNLFSAYSRLSQVLTAGKEAAVIGGASGGKEGGTDLNASIAAAEAAAAALNESNQRRREVMDDALRGVHESKVAAPRPVNYLERDEKERKRRVRVMGVLCAVLAVAALVVNFMLLSPSGPVVDLIPEEFSSAMPLKQATTAAEVMLAETTSDLWEAWTPAERQEHAGELVRQADEKGFSGLWLTDESGRQLAFWEQGTELKLF